MVPAANPAAAHLLRTTPDALAIATVTYVAVALGVFGTLTVEEVIASGGTAIAVAAEPSLGRFGYWLMSVTGPPERGLAMECEVGNPWQSPYYGRYTVSVGGDCHASLRSTRNPALRDFRRGNDR